jgi:hypothetical protein
MEENEKIVLGNQNQNQPEQNIPSEFIDNEFEVPTEQVELPSKGVFYPNNKKSVTVKYLTAEEDDILFSPELIKSGKVLDALLQIAVIDKDLNPNDMLIGDRNAVLIHLRKTGLGDEYQPGKMGCPSCGEEYVPDVNLNDLKLKFIEDMPDENGWYDFELPIMKKKIKFRMLNGNDENKIAKASETGTKRGRGKYKVSKGVTERYRLQIMEVEGNRDKLYISKLISAMPMKDSIAFREYVKNISPGVDFNYTFECKSCGHVYEDDVPMTYRLFYPNAEL